MSTRFLLGPCTSCGVMDVVLPYGCQDALICFECARTINERQHAEPSDPLKTPGMLNNGS